MTFFLDGLYCVRGNHDVARSWGFFAARQNVTGLLVKITHRLFLAGIGWPTVLS